MSKIKTTIIEPLYDRVLIEPLLDAEKTAGGIVLPDEARHKKEVGRVIEVGEGYRDPGGKIFPLKIKKGDHVLFNKYSGADVTVNGVEYKVIGEAEILARVKEE